ncbi:hypothetical protein QNH44_24975 [Cytobacillus firmus]|uniref:hypothetical protein n=1 Tax=Cytobacillus firmus TaxID=1399 RepID=UPI0024C169C9|nr:hypothetical protein [Cytobacillus firmus]WHY34218.1 hypothetical protein QNH44_24975 [Cytobacillus firmus]
MNLLANKNGLFSKEQVYRSGLPVYDFTKGDDIGLPFDFCTRSQLRLLGIELNNDQKKLVKGFVRLSGYRGFASLYSYKEIREFF